jgi:hypothetical protein
MDNYPLVRDAVYNSDILFIDGTIESGKSLISKVVSGYNGVERRKEDEIFYMINKLWEMSKIDTATASTLLKIYVDRILYSQMIGRDINFRLSDTTSFLKTPYPLEHIRRAISKIPTNIDKEKPMFQNMIHNALMNADLFFEAFDKRVKFIYIYRYPIDVINSTLKRTFSDRIGNDPREVQFAFLYNSQKIPLYAVDWKESYLQMDSVNRTVHMIYYSMKKDMDTYKRLSNERKQQILPICFEKFCANPYAYCDKIEKFLGREKTWKVNHILRTSKLGKVKLPMDMSKRKENDLLSKCNPESKELLYKLKDIYDKSWN